jgi:hypothetical protein
MCCVVVGRWIEKGRLEVYYMKGKKETAEI